MRRLPVFLAPLLFFLFGQGHAENIKTVAKQEPNTPSAKVKLKKQDKKPAAKKKDPRPNVLIIVSDDQPDGTMNSMPLTKRFFRQNGVSYPNAYASTALCCPARASIMTGQHVHNHGIGSNASNITKRFPHKRSLQRNLQKAGYKTALFGKFLNGWRKEKRVPGWDIYRSNKNGGLGRDSKITKWASRFIITNQTRPWFSLLGYHSPHWPYTAKARASQCHKPDGWREADMSDKPRYVREVVLRNVLRGAVNSKGICRGQLGELEVLDKMLSPLWEQLTASGQLENTLVFYISDQGFMWGQNGGLTAKFLPYRGVLEVPLYMSWPAGAPNGIDRRLASTIDIAPTIYDATGVRPSFKPDGRSLLRADNKRDWLYSEMNTTERNKRWSARISKDTIYIETYGGRTIFREFYDIRKDPFQRFSRPGQATKRMAKDLRKARRCRGASCH